MQKTLLAILLVLTVCFTAAAERAGKSGADFYMAVSEGEGDALVRFTPDGGMSVAVRADEIGEMTAFGGRTYCLMRTGDMWSVVGIADGGMYTAYEFPKGATVSRLLEQDGMLFVLVDGRLCLLSIEKSLCVRLAGEMMEEFAIYGDMVYFISADARGDTVFDGVKADAGQLKTVDISTGKVATVLYEGAADMKRVGNYIYFHSFAEPYLIAAGGGAEVRGGLCRMDLATGAVERVCGTYDWDYVIAGGRAYVLVQGGIVRAEDGAPVAIVPDTVQIAAVGNEILCFDRMEMRFFSFSAE